MNKQQKIKFLKELALGRTGMSSLPILRRPIMVFTVQNDSYSLPKDGRLYNLAEVKQIALTNPVIVIRPLSITNT